MLLSQTPVMIHSTVSAADGYAMDTLYFTWLDAPAEVDRGVKLPEFTLQNIILYDCSQNYSSGTNLVVLSCSHLAA